MAQKSKAKNYKTNNSRGGAHLTRSRHEESYIVWNFNSTTVALDEAVQAYRRYNEQGMPICVCVGQLETIKQLIITCFIILNGVDDYSFLTSTHERIIREALNILK